MKVTQQQAIVFLIGIGVGIIALMCVYPPLGEGVPTQGIYRRGLRASSNMGSSSHAGYMRDVPGGNPS